MYGAVTWSVTADSTVSRIPAPRTATTVTRVSPIISAAAVEAVRLGLRTELALASSPATPPPRRAGNPTRRVSGFTMCGAADAAPAPAGRHPPQARRRFDHGRGRERAAHEQPQDPDAEQQNDRQRRQPADEDPDADGGHGRRGHDDGRLERVGGEARGRQRRAL